MEAGKNLAKKLLEIQAIKLNAKDPFTWASELKSPIYCDNRISLSYPAIRDFIKQQLIEHSQKFTHFDGIAGVATAGIPHGMLLADSLNLPFIYIRSKAKGHGRQNMIEGDIKAVNNVLVVEDLISTGGSCIQAINALKESNIKISGALALFTYEFEKSKLAFEEAGIELRTISNYSLLLEVAKEIGYINSNDMELLKEWRKNPQEWSKQFD